MNAQIHPFMKISNDNISKMDIGRYLLVSAN